MPDDPQNKVTVVLPGSVQRRRKFTQENCDHILALIRNGAGPYEALRSVGITTETLRAWRRKAKLPGGEEHASFLDHLDMTTAQLQAYSEQHMFKYGQAQKRYPRCHHCEVSYRELDCPMCEEPVPLKCPDCGRALKVEVAGDWRALLSWMKKMFPNKWSDRINIDLHGQLRSFMLAIRDEFEDEPEVFARILQVAMRGAGEDVDPDRR